MNTKDVKAVVSQLLKGLNEKQSFVISGRYGLDKSREGRTLESVGQVYGITRERVRQIQEACEKKLRDATEGVPEYNQFIQLVSKHLESLGGVRRADLLYQELDKKFAGDAKNSFAPEYNFLLTLSDSVQYAKETDDYHAAWAVDNDALRRGQGFLNNAIGFMNKNKIKFIDGSLQWQNWLTQLASSQNLTSNVATQLLPLSKLLHVNSYGELGLVTWPEVKPSSIPDAIHLVLRKANRPMHFNEISEVVNKAYHKKVSSQSVHNELIRSDRFALLNRGIYTLKSKDVLPPLVKDAIHQILKQQGPMSKDQVIKLIKEKKPVQDNTITLALSNKNLFRRLDDGRYNVVES